MILVRREFKKELREDPEYFLSIQKKIEEDIIASCEFHDVSTTEYVNYEHIERMAKTAAINFLKRLSE